MSTCTDEYAPCPSMYCDEINCANCKVTNGQMTCGGSKTLCVSIPKIYSASCGLSENILQVFAASVAGKDFGSKMYVSVSSSTPSTSIFNNRYSSEGTTVMTVTMAPPAATTVFLTNTYPYAESFYLYYSIQSSPTALPSASPSSNNNGDYSGTGGASDVEIGLISGSVVLIALVAALCWLLFSRRAADAVRKNLLEGSHCNDKI
jgi:hypothetical protein